MIQKFRNILIFPFYLFFNLVGNPNEVEDLGNGCYKEDWWFSFFPLYITNISFTIQLKEGAKYIDYRKKNKD